MTRLGAGWSPRSPAGIWPGAAAFGGLPRRTRLGCRVCAGLQTSDADDLVPRPDSDGEGSRAARDDGVGAVVGALERRANGVAANPDEAGGGEVIWQLVWQLLAGIVPRQRKSRSIYCGIEFVNNVFNSNFIILQKLIWQHNWATKNCFSR